MIGCWRLMGSEINFAAQQVYSFPHWKNRDTVRCLETAAIVSLVPMSRSVIAGALIKYLSLLADASTVILLFKHLPILKQVVIAFSARWIITTSLSSSPPITGMHPISSQA